jgi:hypothetical protein
LIEQGLKQVVICAIDQRDFRRRFFERLGRGKSTKATADYNDSWLSHLCLNCLRVGHSNFGNTDARQQIATGEPFGKPLKGKRKWGW